MIYLSQNNVAFKFILLTSLSRIVIQLYKKSLNFSAETLLYLFISTIIKSCVCLSVSTSYRIVSSAISFRLPSDSIPTAASSDSPLSSTFVSDFGLPFHGFHRFLSAFFLLRFHFLSSASVLDSDYSASVSSFPFFLFLPHSGFSSARLLLSLLTSSPFSLA